GGQGRPHRPDEAAGPGAVRTGPAGDVPAARGRPDQEARPVTVDELRETVRQELAEHVPARLVSVETAARALGLGRNTCYQLIRDGRLRSVQVGKRRLIPVQALDEFVADAMATA